jgi:translation initiation factor IF-2
MTQVKKANISKQLNKRADELAQETERLRRQADELMRMLRRDEARFTREAEEARRQQKAEEKQELMRSHTKAWTMPDDDEPKAAPQVKVQEKVATKPEQEQPAAVAAKPEAAKPAPQEKARPEEKKAQPAAPVRAKAPAERPQPRDQQPARSAPRSDSHTGERRPYQQRTETQRTDRAPGTGRQPAQQRGGTRPAYGERTDRAQGQRPGGQRPGYQPGGRTSYPDKDAPETVRGQGSRQRAARPQADDLLIPIQKEQRTYDPNRKSHNRTQDPERVSRNKRQNARGRTYGAYDEDNARGRGRRGKKPAAPKKVIAPIVIENAVMTADTITVKDLSERIGKPAADILKKLFLLGIVANINQELDYDTASLVTEEYDITLELKLEKTAEETLQDFYEEDAEEDLVARPPVITIMGHVDHGKTSLLDYIRRAHVTTTEAGGITQHIGAYSVQLGKRKITFLDTPGHEAFTSMRMRGAQSTDIAVLVVAADDGVMPQTIEAINHAKAAEVPVIVAINKMDKPQADPTRVKQELTSHNLVAEDWGGDTIMVPVSAKTGQGIDDLLEMILLQADVMQLTANPDRMAMGIVVEAKLDRARGPLATVLLKNGTLRVGDYIVAGHASGRVRALQNDRGEQVKSAGPSMPVEVSGFNDVPEAGEEMYAVDDEKLTRQVAQERREKMRTERLQASSKVSLDTLFASIEEGKIETLNIIIKADVQGSTEAVRQALEKLSDDKVKIKVLHSGVGAVTKDDVNLAAAFGAIIIGFNIRPDANARAIAEKEEVDIRLYRVIYQAIEDIEKAMKGMLEPTYKEIQLGEAEVRNVFKVTGSGTIAGCYVTDGKVQRNAQVRLLRDNVVIYEGKLSSLRRFKDDVREVATGYECGIGLENYNDIKMGDVIECFINEEVKD